MKQFFLSTTLLILSFIASAGSVELRELDKIEVIANDKSAGFSPYDANLQLYYNGVRIFIYDGYFKKGFSKDDSNRAALNIFNQIESARLSNGVVVLDDTMSPNEDGFVKVTDQKLCK